MTEESGAHQTTKRKKTFKYFPKVEELIKTANKVKNELDKSEDFKKLQSFNFDGFLKSLAAENSNKAVNSNFVNIIKVMPTDSLLVDYFKWEPLLKLWKSIFTNITFEDYEDFRILDRIAEYFEAKRKGQELSELGLPALKMELSLTDSGKFEVKPSGLAEILEHIEGDRIRRCKICSSFFWAKRIDANTCGAKCLNHYSVILYRSKRTIEQLREEKRQSAINTKEYKKKKAHREKINNGSI
jgi:hypothetical protein